MIAKGTFTVEVKPEAEEKDGDLSFGRFIFNKIFNGDLEATSKVTMLSATRESGAGAYVAIEQIKGTVEGRTGSFVVTHVGTRTSNAQTLAIAIVPGCATGNLIGIEGTINIKIENKQHFYEMDYFFAE